MKTCRSRHSVFGACVCVCQMSLNGQMCEMQRGQKKKIGSEMHRRASSLTLTY